MASKKLPSQTSDMLKELNTLDLQKQQATTELLSYTALLASPADGPVIVTDMAHFIHFSNLADKITVKHPYSNVPGDIRAQQKSGAKGPGPVSATSSSANVAQLIFPPFVQFQSNLRTLSLIPGDTPSPSSAFSITSEASFLSTYTVDTFSNLYSELLVYDPHEHQLSIPTQLPYSLASFRILTMVPFLVSRFTNYSVSVYFQGKDPSRDLLVASPLDALVSGIKEKTPTLFTTLNIGKNPLYLPVTNYVLTEKNSTVNATTDVDSTSSSDTKTYYYHPHIVDIEAAGTKYRCTANWANVLAMGMDCMAINPYKFLITPFSSFMQLSIPFDKSFTPDCLQLFLQCTDKEVSPNMVTFIEFPTLFGVIRDRIRKHFLLSENQSTVRGPLLHKLINDLNNKDSLSPSQSPQKESICKDDSSIDENNKRYSMNLGADSFQDTSNIKSTPLEGKDTIASLCGSKSSVESVFLLNLFESVINEESKLQTPLSLGVIDLLSMEKADYNPNEIFSKPCSRFVKDTNGARHSINSRPTVLSRNACVAGGEPHSLRSLLNYSASSANNSTVSLDSSPFDSLEEYNPDLIFVKLWVSDPVLAVILSDQLTDHEEDFLQTYTIERQLKLYRILEKKHPKRYNNGRYNVGSTEGASASGPIVIGAAASDMSTTQIGFGRGSYFGDNTRNHSLRNSGVGGNSGIPFSLQNDNVMHQNAMHGPSVSIYTGKTTRTRMTAKEAAERRRLLKLESMRSKIYECNQNYLPGRKLIMYKDYDPANFPLGKPEAPWNDVGKEEKPIDILKVNMATIKTMNQHELTDALDTQEKMMKTVSLLPRLREAVETKSKKNIDKNNSLSSNTTGRELSSHSNREFACQDSAIGQQHNDRLAPTPRITGNPTLSSQTNPLTSLLDAPEVQIGSRIDEEEKPKKTKKSRSIRGYRVIDETETYSNKTRVYEEIHCDIGSDDSLFDDDQLKATDMNYCIMRLTTLLELASGAVVLNLQQTPQPVCSYEPYKPEYPTLYEDAKQTGKRSPSTNKLNQPTTKQAESTMSRKTISAVEPTSTKQQQTPFEAATTERPVWRPKLISYSTSQANIDTNQQAKPLSNTGPISGSNKKQQEAAKQVIPNHQECPPQQEDIEVQADGTGSVLLSQTNVLNTATISVIGEKDKAFLPIIKKVQTSTMLQTIQWYQLSALLLKKNAKTVNIKQDSISELNGASHDIISSHTSNIKLPSLNINAIGQDSTSEKSQQDSKTLLLEICDHSPERPLKSRRNKSAGNVHWTLDNWLSSESLLLTFNADYLPIIVQNSGLTSQRDCSTICFMEVAFYFMQNKRVFATRRRGLTTITVDIIKDYCMNTKLPQNLSELSEYNINLFFSISIHSVSTPYPLTLVNRLEDTTKALDTLIHPSTKPSSRSVSASSQTKGAGAGTTAVGEQEQDSSEYWAIDAVQENKLLLEKQLDVDSIEAKFNLDLFPCTQSTHGAHVNVHAIQRYTGDMGIANLQVKPYDITGQGATITQELDTNDREHSPCLQFQSIVTQGILTGMMGTVALFELDATGPDSERPIQTPIATAPTNIPVPAPPPVQDQTEDTLPATEQKEDEEGHATVSLNISNETEHTVLSTTSNTTFNTTFVRLIPCFKDGIPAGATIYIYALDSNSDVLYERVPICINGSLVQSLIDLIISTEQKIFVILEGYSIFTTAADAKSKAPASSGLLPFKLSMIAISDSYLSIKPLRINSNLFQLRTPFKLESDDKSTIELKFSSPGGYCFVELGLVAELNKSVTVEEQPDAALGSVTDDHKNEETIHEQVIDMATTGEDRRRFNDDVIHVNIFHKPLLPVFEVTQIASKSKGSPQKKMIEEDTNVKVNVDIMDVLRDDAIQMAECTSKLVPVLCSGCLLNNRRVYIISIPPSGVIALNIFVPDDISMNYEKVNLHIQSFTFLDNNDTLPVQIDIKGKPIDPISNTISACKANLNEWILQRLCTGIWSRARVLQGEELLARANYLQSAATTLPQITSLPTYSFVPTDELVAYLEHKADTDQAKGGTSDKDKKAKAPSSKKKEVETVTKTAEPLELTLEGMQGQEKDDLSAIIAAEIQALQTFTVSTGLSVSDKKQSVAKKTDTKKDKNLPEPASTIVSTFKNKLSAPRTQAAIEYFDIKMVKKT